MEVRKMNNQKHILKQRWWALVLVVVGIVLYLWLDVSIFPKKAWEKAESENTIAAYEDLMKRYPEGSLADKARLKIEEIYFEEAQTINTIPAYQEFLKQYPKGPVADKAHLMVEKLYNDRKPAFRHTKTVKIIVNQSYGEAEGVSLRFEDIARRLCQYAYLEVVGADIKKYDVSLKIQAKGRAIGKEYEIKTHGVLPYISRRYCYAGASLSGTISLEIPGIPAYTKSFKGYISPPYGMTTVSSNPYPTASSAPFDEALREPGSFISKILEMMGEVYGLNILVAALNDKSGDFQTEAAEVLGEIKDSHAVEPLIAALKDDDPRVRGKAAGALGKIGKPAVEPLIAALEDVHPRVRRAAVVALGEIRDSRAVEPLIAALHDEVSNVRGIAAEALKKITKQDFGQDHDAWLKWWQIAKKKYQQQ